MLQLFSCFKRKGRKDNLDGIIRRRMVIVGDGECGKTSLVSRMSTGNFVDIGYVPTVFETEVVNVNTGEEEVDLFMYDTAGQESYDRLRPFSYHNIDVVLICFSLADTDTLSNVTDNWLPEIRYFCGNVPVILVGNKKDLRDCETSFSLTTSNVSLTTEKNDSTDRNPLSNSFYDDTASHGTEAVDTFKAVINSGESRRMFNPYASVRPIFQAHAPVKHSEGASVAKRIGALAYFETSALTGENVQELLLATTKAAILGSRKAKKFKHFSDSLKSWRSVNKLSKDNH